MVLKEELFSKEQAASLIGISIRTLDRLFKKTSIVPIRQGKSVKFDLESITEAQKKLKELKSGKRIDRHKQLAA